MTWPMTLVPLVPSARSVSMGPLSALVYAETVRYGTPCVRPSCRDDPFTVSTRAAVEQRRQDWSVGELAHEHPKGTSQSQATRSMSLSAALESSVPMRRYRRERRGG